MRNRIKKLAVLTTLVVVVLSVLGVAIYLNIQSLCALGDKAGLIVSSLTNLLTQLRTHLNCREYLSAIEIACANALFLSLFIVRLKLIRRVTR